MTGSEIRTRAILKTLKEKHGGRLEAVGRTDIIVVLCRSLNLTDNMRRFLRTKLITLGDEGKLVIEREGYMFNLVALPGADQVESTDTDDEKAEDTGMPAPKGQHNTKSPRTGEGVLLPTELPDEMVGELHVRTVNDATVDTVADLAYEELCKAGNRRITKDKVVEIIVAVLVATYGEDAKEVDALKTPVFDRMVCIQLLHRVDSKSQACVYDVRLPATAPRTPEEAIAQLMEAAEGFKRKAEVLQAENAELQSQQVNIVDPAKLEKLVTNLEDASTANETLRQQLAEKEAAVEALRHTHQEELRQLNETLAQAQIRINTLEGQLRQRNQIDPELEQRMNKLLGG